MDIPVIYEDESLLVVDKPSGIVVNRSQTASAETLQDWAEKKLEIKNQDSEVIGTDDFYSRAGIVHRLDKETSGLLVIAKTPEAFLDLQAQFKERKIAKKYIALAHGKVAPREGEIRASVGRLPWNRERFGILPGGREAVTFYKVLDYYMRGKDYYSLLEVSPRTGRTHQIRIHLKYLMFPVVSDSFYAGRKTYREDLKFCPRLFLHAASLSFIHPKIKKEMTFKSTLPADLDTVLSKLTLYQ